MDAHEWYENKINKLDSAYKAKRIALLKEIDILRSYNVNATKEIDKIERRIGALDETYSAKHDSITREFKSRLIKQAEAEYAEAGE